MTPGASGDTTEAESLGTEAARSAKRLGVLAEVSNAFARAARDYRRLVETIIRVTADLVGDGCQIFLVGDDGLSLVNAGNAHSDGAIETDIREFLSVAPQPLATSQMVSAHVVRTGESKLIPVIDPDAATARTDAAVKSLVARVRIHSAVLVPIRARDTVIGALSLIRTRDGQSYTAEDQVMLQDIADRAGLAIENARTYEDLERRVRDRTVALEDAYRELQQAQVQLVQAAKMASLGELVAGVAHEINSPLSFAMAHLETVRSGLDHIGRRVQELSTDDVRPQWQRVLDRLRETHLGLDRIRDLVSQLRTFSRLDEGERKVVSVRESVESVLTLLSYRTHDRIDVVTRFGDPDAIECYAGLLNQAILNLVVNAIDAIGDRGTVDIATGAVGSTYSITITDSGHGIPSEIHPRIFEPFFTTKPVGQGTGLGLPLSYAIVKKHGGELEIGPGPGGGTVAVIRIPLVGP